MSSPGGLQPAGPPRARGIHAGFEPASDIWRIVLEKGVTHICFKPIRDHWGDRHADNAKQAALAYMEDRSPDTVNGGVGALARMARHVPVGGTVSAAALMDYRSLLPREQLHYLGHIAAFLKFWVARGYTGVGPRRAAVLQQHQDTWKRQGRRRSHPPPHKGSLHGSGAAGNYAGGARRASLRRCQQAGLRNPSHADRDGVPARASVDARLRGSAATWAWLIRSSPPGAVLSRKEPASASHASGSSLASSPFC